MIQCICDGKNNSYFVSQEDGKQKRRDETKDDLSQILNLLKPSISEDLITTADDKTVEEFDKILKKLGKRYHSEWLVKRSEAYSECHKLRPQVWRPATCLDWLYIEVDYKKFLNGERTKIGMSKKE